MDSEEQPNWEEPKYWNAAKQTVVDGVEFRDTETDVKDLLGTWHFFYCEHPMAIPLDETIGSFHIHALTQHPTELSDVTGHLQMYLDQPWRFKGLEKITPQNSKSSWKILSLKVGEEEDFFLMERGNMIHLTKAEDHNGKPFLILDFTQGPGCHSTWDGFCIGIQGLDLYEEDLKKLGFRLTNAEVEERGKAVSTRDTRTACPLRSESQDPPVLSFSVIPRHYSKGNWKGSEQPKYWDAEKQTVVEGVAIRKGPNELKDFMGTWRFFYCHHPKSPMALEKTTGSFHIHAPKGKIKTKDMTGHINMYSEGPWTFTGLKRIKDERYPSNAGWEILSVDVTDNDFILDPFSNLILLTEVKDHEGKPFLVFDYLEGDECIVSYRGFCIGTRANCLDDLDLVKLGFGLTNEEVEERAKPGFVEETDIETKSDEDSEDPEEFEDKAVGGSLGKREVDADSTISHQTKNGPGASDTHTPVSQEELRPEGREVKRRKVAESV